MTQLDLTLPELYAELERRERGEQMREEAERLGRSLPDFIRAAWPQVEPHTKYLHNWHIDAISDVLTAVTDGHLRKVQIWVPPGTMKSRSVSVLWPAWEWCRFPHLRIFGASYEIGLAGRLASRHRDLIRSAWWRARWPDVFLVRDAERFFSNNQGGSRLATSPTSTGTGEHGDRLLIDDPLPANQAETITGAMLHEVNEWYDGTLPTRFADPKTGVEVIIMQRLNERDLAAHALSFNPQDWEILCLPEEYERAHPFVSPRDIRKKDGELLWPERIGPVEHRLRAQRMGKHRAAGQLQQRPSAREGEILKRASWNYFSPDALAAAYNGDTSKLPPFRRIVHSWDTSFKEKTSSDYVAGGVWGIYRGDRFLLRTFHERASLTRTKQVMKEMREWAIELWPNAGQVLLVEKSANGVEILDQLKREIPGTKPWVASVDKTARAEAAEPDLDSGNVFICGAPNGTHDDYDPSLTPSWAQEVIEECAAFPNAANDDHVDMVTQAINYARSKESGRGSVSSAADEQLPPDGGLPTY